MKRIFIGLKVNAGDTFLKILSSFKEGLSKDIIKWTSVDNIHITLAFLGNTEEKEIKNISSMLKEECGGSGKFELILKGSGLFRKLEDPRIIWIGIEPSEKILQLKISIFNGLKRLSIKIEDRPFRPHLTIGRIKNINDKETLKTLIGQFQGSEIQTIPVNEVILYESILLQPGPVYEPIVRVDL